MGDSAPGQSPVQVLLFQDCQASLLNFSATGSASNVPSPTGAPPDGTDTQAHACGDENGIASVTAPLSALMGVFLTDDPPTTTGTPPALDFSSRSDCNYRTLSPLLKQVFFIGDGMTASGVQQDVIVPPGATRLFLGPMDGSEWNNNSGSLQVTVTGVPDPPTPTATPACAGAESSLSCGTPDPALTYSWDADVGVDSDGNAVTDDDADAAGCDVRIVYSSGGTHVARVTASSSDDCTVSVAVSVEVPAGVPPGEVPDVRVARSGARVTLTWGAVARAASYRIARGDIGAWYSHSADEAASQGVCVTAARTWTDPDDGEDGSDYYYLVTAVDPCGAEGTPGDKWDGVTRSPRDPRRPSGSCP
jgi:hypothetical protein